MRKCFSLSQQLDYSIFSFSQHKQQSNKTNYHFCSNIWFSTFCLNTLTIRELVMYPIINLRSHKTDLHWYLRALEEVVIRVLSSAFSIKGSRVEGSQKLAAIGIRVSRWITYHGLALNVSTDLGPFQQIVPCGIQGRQVGSVRSLLEESVSPSIEGGVGDNLHLNACELLDAAYDSLLAEFSEVFELSLHPRPVSDLGLLKEKC
ncbi:hypothetical protein MKW98_013628 [Papaver atlanticum]|uniref:lipoyl(octanoyl) transferase n=1 Tax=Papaver atlanticum TaxID=357466 RepID=A0AAD4X4Y6_9MAGN|nr:hypothetical protein MKW98_013628 [Papaver atlanticum]